MTTVNATPDPDVTFRRAEYPQREIKTEQSVREQLAAPGNRMGTIIERDIYGLKDSGKREEFTSGAVRDVRQGKGRFDLLPFEGLERVAQVFEDGCAKYGERNWELGMPVSRFIDSALRHTHKYLSGYMDEDHLGMAAWNLMCALTIEERAEAGRLPKELLLESRKDYLGDH